MGTVSKNNIYGEQVLKEHGLKDSLKEFVDHGQQKATAFKDRVVDLQQRARSRGGEALDRGTELVKAHPIAAIGIAFGIGYFAMRLVRR